MDNTQLQQFLAIGKVQSEIKRAASLSEALQSSFRILYDSGFADMIVAWYRNGEDSDILTPEYWICPSDLTGGSYKSGEGCVGQCFQRKEKISILDYNTGMDEKLDALFGSEDICSAVCVPMETSSQEVGCILFLNRKTSGCFTEDNAAVFELLSAMIGLEIDAKEDLSNDRPLGRVLLSARGIEKEYVSGEVVTRVLKGVNLDIYEGEFDVILGESGCGKTTFLNIISGMDKATAGSFVFEGREMSDASESELTEYRRLSTGYIFQSYNLMPNLTAIQNLQLIAELVSNPMDSGEALGLVGLLERKDNYPSQLSGGQQQRVSIARALVKRPALIFADEPTAALDYETGIEVLTALEDVIHGGATLVMVTHNEEIAKMADRVIRMRNGQVYEVTVNRHPRHASELIW